MHSSKYFSLAVISIFHGQWLYAYIYYPTCITGIHILKHSLGYLITPISWLFHMAKMWNAYEITAGKPVGKRPFGRPKPRWEDTIRTYLRDMGWKDVDWMHLGQDRD